jgi:hypothetical protein
VVSGADYTAVRFPAATTAFHLHVGTTDPTPVTTMYPDAAPLVSPSEYRVGLLAVFNSGFKTAAHAGGVMVDGRVITPLVPGLATAAITTTGHLVIGVWGQTLPSRRVPAIAYRQNLTLLVDHGVPTALTNTPAAWGGIINNSLPQPRSALGTTTNGDVIYLASMDSVLPAQLARAMQIAGATTAMELDINPAWPSLGVASPVKYAAAPGFALSLPGEWRDPYTYLTGSNRDFFAVLAVPAKCTLSYPGLHGTPAPQPPRLSPATCYHH